MFVYDCYNFKAFYIIIKKRKCFVIIHYINFVINRVITCGEDAMIKIWDPSITLIQKIDLKIVNPIPDLNNQVI